MLWIVLGGLAFSSLNIPFELVGDLIADLIGMGRFTAALEAHLKW